MSKKILDKVALFHGEGFLPTNLKNGGTILKGRDGLSVRLAKSNGEKTPVGHFYEQHTGGPLPDGSLDLGQTPDRVGNSEFVVVGGKRCVTRRWDPGLRDWRFTALGNNFYRHLRRNYVCITVHGTRDDGSVYTFPTYFPISKLGVDSVQLPLNLMAAERLSRVKQIVARALPQNGVIYEVSRERYEVDTHAHAAWIISEETVADRDNPRGARPPRRCAAEL